MWSHFVLIAILFFSLQVTVQSKAYVQSRLQSQKKAKITRVHDVSADVLDSVLSLRGGSAVDEFDWRFFVAGGLCAAASHGFTTPIGI